MLRAAALASALEVCDEPEAGPIAVELVELALPGSATGGTTQIRALASLLTSWDTLPAEARQLARAAGRSRWGAAAATLEDPVPHARAICRLVEDTADPTLFDALNALLGSRRPEVVARAGLALFGYVRRLRPDLTIDDVADDIEGHPPEPMELPTDVEADPALICSALAEIAWRYADHRSRWAMIVVALVAPALDRIQAGAGGERLRRLIGQPTHPAGSGLRAVLRRSRCPAMRAAAWRLLADSTIAGPALERFAVARGVQEHERILELSHLVLRPMRRDRLALFDLRARPDRRRHADDESAPAWRLPTDAPLPGSSIQRRLSARARRGIPRLAAAIPMDDRARELIVGPLLADPDASVRHAGMRVRDGADVIDSCFDADWRIARSSAYRVSPVGAGWVERGADSVSSRARRRLFEHLCRSPHASVRAGARDDVARTDPWDPAEPASRVLARAMLRSRSSGAFLAELRRRVVSGAGEGRVRAIRLSVLIQCVEAVAPEVIAAARAPTGLPSDEASRVSACAAAALAHEPSDDARRALTFCLSHPDDRVRANAVEALSRRARSARDLGSDDPATYAVLIELKGDPNNRVRANALRGLLDRPAAGDRVYEPSAVGTLSSMLEDDRAEHRVSALWLVDRLASRGAIDTLGDGSSMLCTRVVRLAENADIDAERARAARASARFAGAARSAWSSNAPRLLSDDESSADQPGPLRNGSGARRLQSRPTGRESSRADPAPTAETPQEGGQR